MTGVRQRSRERGWREAIGILRDFPIVGVGMGCGAELFPRYQSPPWEENLFWHELHNDYLQLVAEGGLIGLSILAACAICYFYAVRKSLRSAKGRSRAAIAAISAGILVIAFHRAVDF